MAKEITASQIEELDLSQADVSDYWSLLKPRVMSLVIFTAFVGIMVAPGTLPPFLAFIALLCIAVGAGASGALNMWYDADIDAVMIRTKNRPIPSGAVRPREALAFGIILSVFSVTIMGLLINWHAAFWLAFTIFFYAVIYTMWLKRSTPQNIVIGGAAGAFPPLIGWVSVTGSLAVEPVILFLMIFIWTPPHFWALSLYRYQDYQRANVPMMPHIAGMASTKKQMFIYTIALAPITILPALIGMNSFYYGAVAALSSLIFIALTYQLWRCEDDNKALELAKKIFAFSILHLFGLFSLILIDHLTFMT